mgnify:CR=1 FL=1
MKGFLTIALLTVFTNSVFSQDPKGFPSTEVAQGTIAFPQFLDLTITVNPVAAFNFSSGRDFSEPKVCPACVLLSVKSTAPWTVSAYCEVSAALEPTQTFSAELISIRKNTAALYTPLSSIPVSLLQSETNDIVSHHHLDLKVDPPFNVTAGSYIISISFLATQQ